VALKGMRFGNRCCWELRIAGESLVELRACLDSALVQKRIDDDRG
jgi:hypothetical protein